MVRTNEEMRKKKFTTSTIGLSDMNIVKPAKKVDAPQKKVSVGVIGGGIAGLTVAHELGERGFDVTIYDKEAEVGGRVKTTVTEEGEFREHSIKNFTAYYCTLFETLKRIPVHDEEGKTVFDNLQPYEEFEMKIELGEGNIEGEVKQINTSTRLSLARRIRESTQFRRWLNSHDVSTLGVYKFLYKHVRLLWMCEQRRRRELASITYRHYLGEGKEMEMMTNLIEITAAANVEGPADVATLHSLKIFGRFKPHHPEITHSAIIMNGPQSMAWFKHWVVLLESFGVKIRNGVSVDSLTYDESSKTITGARTTEGEELQHDIYVVCVPINRFKYLLHQSGPLVNVFPTISPFAVESNEKWAHNLHVVLHCMPSNDERINLSGKATAVLSSPWSIIYVVFSKHIWKEKYMSGCGPCQIMFTFSNADRCGILYRKPYRLCSPEEIYNEVVAQCDFLEKEHVKSYHFGDGLDLVEHADRAKDPGARYSYLPDGKCLRADGVLATRGIREQELSQRTPVKNMFLATEFTKCIQEVATMEKANESAKRAAACILSDHGIPYPMSKYVHHDRPLAWARKVDAWFGGNGWKYLWPLTLLVCLILLPFMLVLLPFFLIYVACAK